MDCGCDDPAHEESETAWDDGGQLEPLGQVHQLDPDAETVIVEMNTVLYGLLVEAGQLQDRDAGVVLRRALEHYLGGCESGCLHQHDERPRGTARPPAPLPETSPPEGS